MGFGQVIVLTETSAKEVRVNERFNLSIGLEISGENLEQQSPLMLPDLSKFNIIGNASDTFTSIDPTTKTIVKQMIYHLVLEPKQTGKVKIGSALVQVNGKMYKSEPFDITVKEFGGKIENTLSKDVVLNLEVDNAQVYENEPVIVVLRAYSKNYDNFRKVHQVEVPKNANMHPISSKKEDVEFAEGNAEMASQILGTYLVYPDKAGNITIPGLAAKLDHNEKTKVVSNPLKINVKKLPEGAPRTYKNAVGKFTVDFKNLGDKEVEVDKPVLVSLSIAGKGNLKDLEMPKLKPSSDFDFFTPKIVQKIVPTKEGFAGHIIAEYIVLPKKEGSINIQVEDFAYFNPDKAKYVEVSIPVVGLDILSSESIQAKKSTIDKVLDNTNKVLESVILPPIAAGTPSQNTSPWSNVLLNFAIVLGLGSIVFSLIKGRKNRDISAERKPVVSLSNIAETELAIRNNQNIDLDSSFAYMENAMNKKDYETFFKAIEELEYDVENLLIRNGNASIKSYLEEKKGRHFAEEFQLLQHKISMEKYAPIHENENIEALYDQITKMYHNIVS